MAPNDNQPEESQSDNRTNIPSLFEKIKMKFFSFCSSPYFSLTILVLCNFLNYTDRYIVFGLLKSLQTYFMMNDKEAGLLQTSFLIFYMIFSVFFGVIGDHMPRRLLISAGIIIWATATFLCSYVPQDKLLLFYLCRAVVGIGEASLSTLGMAMIGDLFDGPARTRALSFFYITLPFGSGVGYLLGPQIEYLAGTWRWAFRFTPILGIIIAIIIIFFMKDPLEDRLSRIRNEQLIRPSCDNPGANGQENSSNEENTSLLKKIRLSLHIFFKDFRYLALRRAYVFSTIGYTFSSFVLGCLSVWTPKFMTVANENFLSNDVLSEKTVILIFGIITIVSGIVGVVLGGEVANYRLKTSKTADCEICVFSTMISLPFIYLSTVSSHINIAMTWVFITLSEFFLCFCWTPISNVLFKTVSTQHRALASGLQIFIMHAFGDAISPVIIGSISDCVRREMFGFDFVFEASSYAHLVSLSYAFLLMPIVLILAALFYILSEEYFIKDSTKATTENQQFLSQFS